MITFSVYSAKSSLQCSVFFQHSVDDICRETVFCLKRYYVFVSKT